MPSELGVPAVDIVKVLLLKHLGRVSAEGAACDIDALENEGAGDALEDQPQTRVRAAHTRQFAGYQAHLRVVVGSLDTRSVRAAVDADQHGIALAQLDVAEELHRFFAGVVTARGTEPHDRSRAAFRSVLAARRLTGLAFVAVVLEDTGQGSRDRLWTRGQVGEV